MKEATIPPLFHTRNIAVASTLMAMGYQLNRIESIGSLKVFAFDRADGIEEAVEDFWKNKLLVEPQALLAANLNIRIQMRER